MLSTQGRWLAALAFVVASSAYTANATVVTCDSSIEDNVVTNSGCEVSDETHDVPQPDVVNGEAFFSFSDWEYDGKFEGTGTEDSSLADFTGDGGSGGAGTDGTWTLLGDDFWSLYSHILFVFKDGAETTLVGYLLTAADGLSGTWTTPFIDPPFDFSGGTTEKETSFIGVYFRQDGGTPPQEIPEPTSLLLLGSGLVGLGAWRRRARRA